MNDLQAGRAFIKTNFLSLMTSSSIINYQELLEILDNEFRGNEIKRLFVAIAGAPASGKSTISVKLNEDINNRGHSCKVLQMDGYHYDDVILNAKNLLPYKGAPETFDVAGLKNTLYRLQNEEEVIVPVFDRSLELSRSSAYIIPKETKIVLVEGNYLLLNSYPWRELHQHYHYTILLDCNEKTLEQRLIERWTGFKLDKDQINKKVYENDLPNGIKVIQNSIQPTFKLKN